jgi:hypothetical protein
MSPTYYLAGTASSPSSVAFQFRDLVNSLSEKNFTMAEDFPADLFVSVNHNPTQYNKYIASGGKPEKTVLILLEPPAVYPSQYKSRSLRRYSLVLAPGSFKFSENTENYIPWPYEAIPNPLVPSGQTTDLAEVTKQAVGELVFDYQIWNDRKYFLSMINANKVSPIKTENYTLRRKYAHELDGNKFFVFGDYWNSSLKSKIRLRVSILVFSLRNFVVPNLKHIYGNLHWRFKTSKGAILDKQEILRLTKFSLVIENDESYISEKLIDSLVNGCIPIYRGPKIPSEIMPPGIFLELPSKPKDLIPSLEALTVFEIRNILGKIADYVSSENFISRWDKSVVFEQCAHAISQQFGGSDE